MPAPAPAPVPDRRGLRVLVLSAAPGIPLDGPSGSSAHLRGVIRALSRRGAAVRVAVPRVADRRGAVGDLPDVPITTCPPSHWGWLPRRFRERGEREEGSRLLTRAIAAGGLPDLIWERHSLFCDAGARLAARHHIPRIVEINAPLATERARYEHVHDPAFAAQMERAALAGASRVIAVSRWLSRWARSEVGCPSERIRLVPNGVEPRARGERRATRERLGLDGLVIGFLGSHKPWHGLQRLPQLLDALPEATALVAGDGPVSVPAHPRLIALGRVAPGQVPDVVSAMDVGLAPYARDAPDWFCPLKILDYLAQGVAVVAADKGDCALLLGRGGGEVVGDDALDTWAAAIRRQASTPRISRVRTWDDVVAEALAGATR